MNQQRIQEMLKKLDARLTVTTVATKNSDPVTLTNLFMNGNFETDISSWVTYEGNLVRSTEASIGSYSLEFTTPFNQGGATAMSGNFTTTVIENHKYYFSMWCKSIPSIGTTDGYATCVADTPVMNDQQLELTPNIWLRMSFVDKVNKFSITDYWFGGVSNYYEPSMSQKFYFDGFMLIDLTSAFGAGKEPTKEEMDSIVADNGGYWDGSKIVIP